MQPKVKNVPRNGLYPPKVYGSTHLYIVDDIDPNAQPWRARRRGGRVDPHTYKCNYIREFFQKYTNTEIHSVRFPQGTRGQAFINYWREELATKTTNDLVIVYFHGSAGGEDKDYKWNLSQYPKIQINAHQLIHRINDSDADSLIIIEGFIQTRFTDKWKCTHGNLEIIASPARMQNPDGRVTEHDGDFTESMVDDLELFVDEINGDFVGHKKMKSILDIMRGDKTMYSNPVRLRLNQTKYGGEEVIKRFRICPERIRQNIRDRVKKLDSVTVIVQGPPEPELAEMMRRQEERRLEQGDAAANDLFDDEGFEEMDEDVDGGSADDDIDSNGGGGAVVAAAQIEEANGAGEAEAAAADGDETTTDNGTAREGSVEDEDPSLFLN